MTEPSNEDIERVKRFFMRGYTPEDMSRMFGRPISVYRKIQKEIERRENDERKRAAWK